MAAGGTPSNVDLGPGRLYVAPLGTAEPVNCSAALPSAWIPIGYTEDGTEFQFGVTREAVEVAEEVDPIGYEMTRRTSRLVVNMAEMTARRLGLALGAGASRGDTAAKFTPPKPGDDLAVVLVWDRDEVPSANNVRWVFHEAKPSGSVNIANRKAPKKRTIATTFECYIPGTTSVAVDKSASFDVYPNASGQV